MKHIKIQCSGKGIGDAVMGLHAALTLSTQLGYMVDYSTHAFKWFEPLRDYNFSRFKNLVIYPYQNIGVDVCNGYNEEFTGIHEHRIDRYLKCLIPDDLTIKFRQPYPSCEPYLYENVKLPHLLYESERSFVIAPFATTTERQWPMANFARLATLLINQGHKVVIICSAQDKARALRVFKGLPFSLVIGNSPVEVILLLRNCKALITNDSGMAHIGNLYKAPTYVIMAQFPFRFVFDQFTTAPTTVGIEPQGTCAPCFFSKPKHSPECKLLGCSSLYSITVDRVFNTLQQLP